LQWSARAAAAVTNGDLLVATGGTSVYLAPDAEGDGMPGKPVKFTDVNDGPTQGITYDPLTCTIYVASSHGIYKMNYKEPRDRIGLGGRRRPGQSSTRASLRIFR